MEDNGQPQFVSHGRSALKDWTWGHGRGQNRQVPTAPQDGERWEINESTELPEERRFLCVRLDGSRNILAFPETPARTAIEKEVCIPENGLCGNGGLE
jgi:hypothetical protein